MDGSQAIVTEKNSLNQDCRPAQELRQACQNHRSSGKLHLLIFFHLEHNHWTVFTHNLNSEDPDCMAYNSLQGDLDGADVNAQFSMSNFVRSHKKLKVKNG